MSQPYAEALVIQLAVSYIPYFASSREQTGNIIILAYFEDGNILSVTRYLLSETRDNTKSGNKSDDCSTLIPLVSEEGMDALISGDDYDAEPMSTDMLEDIRDGSQSHPGINRRETRYKIFDHNKRGQT